MKLGFGVLAKALVELSRRILGKISLKFFEYSDASGQLFSQRLTRLH